MRLYSNHRNAFTSFIEKPRNMAGLGDVSQSYGDIVQHTYQQTINPTGKDYPKVGKHHNGYIGKGTQTSYHIKGAGNPTKEHGFVLKNNIESRRLDNEQILQNSELKNFQMGRGFSESKHQHRPELAEKYENAPNKKKRKPRKKLIGETLKKKLMKQQLAKPIPRAIGDRKQTQSIARGFLGAGKLVIPIMLKQLGIKNKHLPKDFIKKLKGQPKITLPGLITAKLTQMGHKNAPKKLMGSGMLKTQDYKKLDKHMKQYLVALHKHLKKGGSAPVAQRAEHIHYFVSGSGKSFTKKFGNFVKKIVKSKGFKTGRKILKTASKVGAVAAPFIGAPELSPVLGLASQLL
jgi:hypothetical protein